MLLDSQLEFDPAGTAITSTQVSTNIINLVNARDMGIGTPLAILVSVTTAFTSTNSATLQVQAQGSTDSTTWSTYIETPALTAGVLTQYRYLLATDWPRPGPGQALPQYLRLNYPVGTGIFSAGAVAAYLLLGRDDIVYYPRNYAV